MEGKRDTSLDAAILPDMEAGGRGRGGGRRRVVRVREYSRSAPTRRLAYSARSDFHKLLSVRVESFRCMETCGQHHSSLCASSRIKAAPVSLHALPLDPRTAESAYRLRMPSPSKNPGEHIPIECCPTAVSVRSFFSASIAEFWREVFGDSVSGDRKTLRYKEMMKSHQRY